MSRVANCLDWLTARIPAPLTASAVEAEAEAEESPGGVEIDALLMALVSLLTLSAFLLLYIFRALDDNSLVSWQWAFVGVDVRPLLLAMAVAIAASLALSWVQVPVRLQAAALIGGSFLAAVALWPIPEVNVDAARYFVQAKSLELHGAGYFFQHWGGEIPAWTDLPLVPFIYGLVFGVLGEQRFAIQVVSPPRVRPIDWPPGGRRRDAMGGARGAAFGGPHGFRPARSGGLTGGLHCPVQGTGKSTFSLLLTHRETMTMGLIFHLPDRPE